MKDVRIVIVSWNVEDLLGRCLHSLQEACEGVDWEAVVVDNNSADSSVDVAEKAQGNIRVIRNTENRGFAKACNQGITGSDARYVLLLNPDVECSKDSITDFIHYADRYSQIGIFGPSLKNSDGSDQRSVRAFPGVWDQAGVLMKLHRLLPGISLFQKYFHPLSRSKPITAGEMHIVDQVMGAVFLIRREVIERIGALDERYFIWFEEVDYCRAAKENGWLTALIPSVSFIHHSGKSFAQVEMVQKQKHFAESMVHYFQKWHPGWRATVIRMLRPISITMAWSIEIIGRYPWLGWMMGIFLFECVSRATVFAPIHRAGVTVLAGAIIAFLAYRKPHIALVLLFTELLIGSKGMLTKIPEGWEVDGGISLRIVITAAFLGGWIVSMSSVRSMRRFIEGRGAWIALAALVIHGVARGLVVGNDAFIQDANAWGYLVLLLPVLDIARRYGARLINVAKHALIASLLWLPLKTIGLLYIWSHGIKAQSQPMYLWIRRTGVGEVTLVTGNLFRVFIQSQIFAIGAILFAAARFLERKANRMTFAILTASIISILISLSRSFWIGLFFGLITICVLYFRSSLGLTRGSGMSCHPELDSGSIRMDSESGSGMTEGRGMTKVILIGFGALALAVFFIFATVAFPFPKVDTGSLSTLFGSRGSTTDAAAASRWNLLPVLVEKIKEAPLVGSGFGATVTYQTKDPRILAQNPEGWYTTHAFEWGWLEHWIKFGILGIPVMLWLLISIGRRLWKLDEPWWIRAGFASLIVALGALHIFTPYLNHPLGFGVLLAAEGYIEAKKSS